MKCSCLLQNNWLKEGEKTINTFQVSAQSQYKNLSKISNLKRKFSCLRITFKKYSYSWLRDLEISLKYVHYIFQYVRKHVKDFPRKKVL